jgi:hypothetical protein
MIITSGCFLAKPWKQGNARESLMRSVSCLHKSKDVICNDYHFTVSFHFQLERMPWIEERMPWIESMGNVEHFFPHME